MAYWFLEKESGRAEIYGSMVAISQNENFKLDMLQYHFTRHKRKEFENDKHRIVKTNVVPSNGG